MPGHRATVSLRHDERHPPLDDNPAVLPPPAAEPAPTVAPSAVRSGSPGPAGKAKLKDSLRLAERAILLEALERNRWQMARTARELGLERSHLYRKLKGLGIRPPD